MANLGLSACVVILAGWTGSGAAEALGEVISWQDTAVALRTEHYNRRSLICPPTNEPGLYQVWGTDIYTDNSSICAAGVHAGVITVAGGPVTIEEIDGLETYAGTSRNGVVSLSSDAWFFSFGFVSGP